MEIANLWQWQGRVKRGLFFTVGVVGFLVKFCLDWVVAVRGFQHPWGLPRYLHPFGSIQGIYSLPKTDIAFAFVMLSIALPFIWLGIAMCVKRLRDAGQPVWLVGFFFVPFLNLVFFLTLCLVPSTKHLPLTEAAPWPSTRPLDRLIPHGQWESAIVSMMVTSVLGFLLVLTGTKLIQSYGWGLFVALPFCLGLFSVLLHSYHEPRSYRACMQVALMPIVLLGGLLLIAAVEGLVCILMASPFAFALAVAGGWLGYGIQAVHWGRKRTPAMMSLVLLITPMFFSAEYVVKPQPSTFAVKSAVEINAPPEKVWKEVVSFAQIEPPKELLFRAGIAYPIRAEIYGHGVGAVRLCVFSTGPFVEPIQVWDEPHLLRFTVTSIPAPLEELTPYSHIEPPHLHGYFHSHQGQFLLTELPGGRTRVEGTTWYSTTMWPEFYWHLWSDYVIHRIHLRVLNHIKTRVEGQVVAGPST